MAVEEIRRQGEGGVSKHRKNQPAKTRIGAAGKDSSKLKFDKKTAKKYWKRSPDKKSR
jgi:hypothetical protein